MEYSIKLLTQKTDKTAVELMNEVAEWMTDLHAKGWTFIQFIQADDYFTGGIGINWHMTIAAFSRDINK